MNRLRPALVAVGVVGAVAAVAVRLPFLAFESNDWRIHLSEWWAFLVESGGFSALAYGFSDYPQVYLYFLAAASYLDPWVSGLAAVKGLSFLFESVSAYFVFRCVRLRWPAPSPAPMYAAAAAMLAPTVVLNGAMWGQADAVYTAFLTASLYWLLRGRRAWAFLCFGLSVSAKLQALFFAPLLLWVLLKRGEGRAAALLVPLVWLASLGPAWWIGRPFGELLAITSDLTTRVYGLSSFAPTMYAWIPHTWYQFYPLFAAAAAFPLLAVGEFLVRSRKALRSERLVLLAAFAVLLTPWILPKMMARHFYPANVLSIVLAFWWPRYWWVPVVSGCASTLGYLRIQYGVEIVPTPWIAVAPLVLIGVLAVAIWREFGESWRSPARDVRNAGERPAGRRSAIDETGSRVGGVRRLRASPVFWPFVLALGILAGLGGRQVMEQRSANGRVEAAEPAVFEGGGWSVYWEEAGEGLLFAREICGPWSPWTVNRFVVLRYPEDPGEAARRGGFREIFEFEDQVLHWRRPCVAAVPLADAGLGSVAIGQVRRLADGSWEGVWGMRLDFGEGGPRVGEPVDLGPRLEGLRAATLPDRAPAAGAGRNWMSRRSAGSSGFGIQDPVRVRDRLPFGIERRNDVADDSESSPVLAERRGRALPQRSESRDGPAVLRDHDVTGAGGDFVHEFQALGSELGGGQDPARFGPREGGRKVGGF